MKRTRCLTMTAALCGAVIALAAAPVLAQSPAADAYDETGHSTIPPLDVPPSSTAAPPLTDLSSPRPAESGRLPFTGFEAPALALIGGALLAGGALTRRRVRSHVA